MELVTLWLFLTLGQKSRHSASPSAKSIIFKEGRYAMMCLWHKQSANRCLYIVPRKTYQFL